MSDDIPPKPIGITNGTITLMEDASGLASKLVVQYHYSHKTTPNHFLSFLVNKDQGALQLGYGIRPAMKHTISKDIVKGNYCEFDRMWLSDVMPKNSESQVIALLLSYLKQVHPRIKFVITYADESVGNKGTIYQATNAIELPSVPTDFYLLPSGERIHPVTMWHRHKTRAKAFVEKQYPGIKHIKGTYKQRRYLYILNNGLRRKFQERNDVLPAHKAKCDSSAPLQFKQTKSDVIFKEVFDMKKFNEEYPKVVEGLRLFLGEIYLALEEGKTISKDNFAEGCKMHLGNLKQFISDNETQRPN